MKSIGRKHSALSGMLYTAVYCMLDTTISCIVTDLFNGMCVVCVQTLDKVLLHCKNVQKVL